MLIGKKVWVYSDNVPEKTEVKGLVVTSTAIFFTIPPTGWREEVWELARLVRHPEVSEPLTALIAEACSWIRRRWPCSYLPPGPSDPLQLQPNRPMLLCTMRGERRSTPASQHSTMVGPPGSRFV